MSFQSFFQKKQTLTALCLVDIGADSIGVGYALVSGTTPARVIYSVRAPIHPHAEETPIAAMERTFREVGTELIRDGAPALARVHGTGTADLILVSVAAPWQKTELHTKHKEDRKPFVVTHKLVESALESARTEYEGRFLVDESVVGTIVNGYPLQDPYGVRATRLTISVLTSTVDAPAAENIAGALRALFHTHDIMLISSASLTFQAVRTAFPHEKDLLIVTATANEISLALIRSGLLVEVADMPCADEQESSLTNVIHAGLGRISKGYPLPHKLILIAPPQKQDALTAALTASTMDTLWLSNEKPLMHALAPSHIAHLARTESDGRPDLGILLMALHAAQTFTEKE